MIVALPELFSYLFWCHFEASLFKLYGLFHFEASLFKLHGLLINAIKLE